MKFENVLADIDGFGKFQIMIIVINFVGRVTLPCHFVLNNFAAATPAHYCYVSFQGDFDNLSQAEKMTVSIPMEKDGKPSSCRMFAEPQYHLLLNSSDSSDAPTVPCQNGWVYDNTTFKSTITSEVILLTYFPLCVKKSFVIAVNKSINFGGTFAFPHLLHKVGPRL